MRRSSAPSDAAVPRSRPALVAAVLLVVHALLAWSLRIPSITTGNDDATYLLLARALRGLSYADIWLVGAPPHTKYPPLYPASIAILQSVAGERLDVVLAFNVLLSVGALALLYAAVRRWSPWLAVAVVAVCAVNPTLVASAGRIHSESLFMLLTAGSFWCATAPSPTRRTDAGAVALAIGAALTRTIGVTVVAAVLVHWLVRRRLRPAAALALTASVTVGGWLAWTALSPTKLAGYSYLADAVHQAPPAAGARAKRAAAQGTATGGAASKGAPEAVSTPGSPGTPSLVAVIGARVRRNVPAYLTRDLPTTLALPTVRGTRADNVLWLATIVLLGICGAVVLARPLAPAVLFVAAYGTLLAVWPYVITRYLIPCIPWIVLLLLGGAAWLGTTLGGRWRVGIPLLLAALMMASGTVKLFGKIQQERRCERSDPFTDPDCFRNQQRAFLTAAVETRRLTPPGAVFLSSKEGTLYYLSGRRSVQELAAVQLDAPRLRRFLRDNDAEYILLSQTHLDQRALTRPLRQMCKSLEVVRAFADHTVLLRLVPGRARDGGLAGCAAVARYAATPW